MTLEANNSPDSRYGVELSRDRVYLFGRFLFERERRPHDVGGSGCRRLVALLAVRGTTQRAIAAGLLWPDATEDRASGSLRTTVWKLRRAGIDLTSPQRSCLALPETFIVDVDAFRRFAQRLERPAALLDEDLDLSFVPRGDLLPLWSETWAVLERERLHQMRLRSLELLAREFMRRGRLDDAVDAAACAVEIDHLRETATRILIEAHLRRHDIVAAVRRLEVFRRDVRDELNTELAGDLDTMIEFAVRNVRGGQEFPASSTSGRQAGIA